MDSIMTTDSLKYLLAKKGLLSEDEVKAIDTADSLLKVLIDKGVILKEDLDAYRKEAGDFVKKVFELIETGQRVSGEAMNENPE